MAKVNVTDTEQSIDPAERREIEQLRRRREVRTFTSLNVPIGATLTFTKDADITCTVVQPRKVLFRSEELSPTAAARLILHEMGYDWVTFNGMAYWEYDGVKLFQMGVASAAELGEEAE